MKHPTATPSRWDFLAALGLTALSSALPMKTLAAEQDGAMVADPSREMNPTGSNLDDLKRTRN